MKSFPKLFATATLVVAAVFPVAAVAAPVVVLDEGFEVADNLPGWTYANRSVPRGQWWGQGNEGVFAAHSGAATSYAAANFNSALNGTGIIDNWLITPQLSLLGPTVLSFFTRGASAPGFNDTLEIRFSTGGLEASDFSTLLRTVGGADPYPIDWQQLTASIDWEGTGRFAFRYTGNANVANYIGLDTVSVTTVPEPSEYLMMLAGLALLATLRRKQAR